MDKNGFTLIEIMVVVVIVTLLVTIAVPNFLRSRIQAIETAAHAALKNIYTAQIGYRSTNLIYGNLSQLGSPAAGPGYIDSVLGCAAAPCIKNSYQFNITDVTAETYHVNAVFSAFLTINARSFCITEDGIIRVKDPGGAIADRDACLALPATQP